MGRRKQTQNYATRIANNRARYEVAIMQDIEILKPFTRWVAQLKYNHIRRVESLFENAIRSDGRPLRGIQVSDDLVLTRQRMFYRIVDNGTRAEVTTLTKVSQNYNLRDMQVKYRAVQDAWKAAMRKRA